ncbi:Permease YjgP/YjgQ [hydrothermal vent metagenome]|uniref:Permease YjgP/YjgQ n=1 Tax=hydrothermal vent metagenome TaxID=652676 RepID=A0A1W1EJJ7_9ZZZZ
MYYISQEALALLYPLALIFGAIMTKISFIKSNALGALYSFGYSRKDILLPFIVVALLTHLIFIYLHTTSFSYGNYNSKFLYKNSNTQITKDNLFFKYNNSFVYVKKLDPIKRVIYDIKIFEIKNYKLISTITASKAKFNNNLWIAEDVTIKTPIYINGNLSYFKTTKSKTINTLKGYEPQMIKQIYQNQDLNIIDSYNSYQLLTTQELDSYKMRSSIYTKTIFPLFAIFLIIIIFLKMPTYARFTNISISISMALASTFSIWGFLFALNQIGFSGTIAPEFTTILPIILLGIYAMSIYIGANRRI